MNLEPEKQERILNASMKEFAGKGYEQASTNAIVKEAGISKGLLFHYFQNKKQLYLFLYDYCLDLVVQDVFARMDLSETDFFQRLRQATQVKMELLRRYPELFRFLEEVYMEQAAEVKPELEGRHQRLTEANMGRMFAGVDFSRFREDLDLQKMLHVVVWTFEKFGEEELRKAKLSPVYAPDYDRMFAEAEEYFEVFITCFYKGKG
nr:TetR/AcrR family transcriptional regulator [Ectobacillus ponti]